MQKFVTWQLLFISVLLILISCIAAKKTTKNPEGISRINYIGQYEIPFDLQYNNTTVGGLSGIDYDSRTDLYYIISDDRSDKDPARFYTARIFVTQRGIDSVVFVSVKNMLQQNSTVYPNNKQDRYHTPDPEAVRFNRVTNQLVWSSEGERLVTEKDTVLENPSIIIIRPDGSYADSFPLPANLNMQVSEKGPRRNGVLEGMSFADNFKTLFVNMEEPLYEDGPRADVSDNEAYIRICKFGVADRKNIAQFAYKLSPVAFAPIPDTAFKINGVPDILSVGHNKLLVIERSFSAGRTPCTIKLFIADISGATDISNIVLEGNKEFIPAPKKLLLNLDKLGIFTGNIEGVTYGPVLPNGHKTLLLIADNNFSPLEKTQLLLFEVVE